MSWLLVSTSHINVDLSRTANNFTLLKIVHLYKSYGCTQIVNKLNTLLHAVFIFSNLYSTNCRNGECRCFKKRLIYKSCQKTTFMMAAENGSIDV